ncbi:MAG TPA: chemotaxis protein CheA, partial [Planctomycetaceae bacterium]|nr:chemotaxis protein CheA [Planctomycetaceae bacterium]
MFEEDAGLLADFVVEANEGLAEIETDLLAIEERGADIDVDLVNKVFRAIHSIKGAAGFLALEAIGALSHSMENVLSLVRSRSLVPTPPLVDCLLKSADLLKRMIDNIETSNSTDVSKFVTALTAIANGEAAVVEAAPVEAEPVYAAMDCGSVMNGYSPQFESSVAEIDRAREAGQNLNVVKLDLLSDREGKNPVGLIQRLRDTGAIVETHIDTGCEDATGNLTALPLTVLHSSMLDSSTTATFFQIPPENVFAAEPHHLQEEAPAIVEEVSEVPAESVVETEEIYTPPQEPAVQYSAPVAADRAMPTAADLHEDAPAEDKRTSTAEANIRVAVAVLDRLMNLAGELVLSRNQLLQTLGSGDARALDSVANRIDQVTTELQETIMQTRMQPIGNVFGKFTRVVRDLSKTLGKQCQLEIEGKDVELDKTIIESIGDPLTHLVRNAMDHGLETPQTREKNGKNPVGTVRLAASHQEGKVLLAISDDGAGIDPAKLRRKAVEKGLITPEAAQAMSDRDAVHLIFAPGFSTAEQVTAVSGRGVGMDVVKTNFERLGGSVEIDTEVGMGTTITVRLPLT